MSERREARIRDLMTRAPITVRPESTVGELMRTLSREHIGGVPVVDRDQVVVGVVSASDVLGMAERERAGGTLIPPAAPAAEESGETREPEERPSGFFGAPEGPLWHFPLAPSIPLLSSKLETTPVRDVMMPATFSVRPDASVQELARFLLRAGVHRALVFDGSKLAGIVTTMDVLRAVVGE